VPKAKSPAPSSRRGFTLIEILVVVAILSTVSLVTFLGFFGRKRATDLSSVNSQIVAVLHEAQNRSMTQYQGSAWGVHFESGTSTFSFYALFHDAYSTTTVADRYVLPSDTQFASSTIPAGTSLDIVFAQITGIPSASTTITVDLVSGNSTAAGSPANVSRQSSGKVFFDNFSRSTL
jgi:prepilin-type N-terminal cleavage/methylation domain-containing protein